MDGRYRGLFRPSGGAGDASRMLAGAVDIHVHIDPLTDRGRSTRLIREACRFERHARDRLKEPLRFNRRARLSRAQSGPSVECSAGSISTSHGRHQSGGRGTHDSRVRRMGRVCGCRHSTRKTRCAPPGDRPFVRVSDKGELLPRSKVISLIAKHGLVLATGHSVHPKS